MEQKNKKKDKKDKKDEVVESDASSEEDGYLDSKEVDYMSDTSSGEASLQFQMTYHQHSSEIIGKQQLYKCNSINLRNEPYHEKACRN